MLHRCQVQSSYIFFVGLLPVKYLDYMNINDFELFVLIACIVGFYNRKLRSFKRIMHISNRSVPCKCANGAENLVLQ
jgi:hypothetical protein